MAATSISRLIDIAGNRYGRLTVVRRVDDEVRRKRGYWVCGCDCGAVFEVYGTSLRNGNCRSCGCLNNEARRSRHGAGHPCWRGGRQRRLDGYILIKCRDHPNTNNHGYVAEHVLAMTEHLGRPLDTGETVHHKNGVKDDNRLENLELRTHIHPPGQSIEQMVEFCVSYLKRYAPEKLR